jgi:adenosylcobinamide-GDP ribazoletransferase
VAGVLVGAGGALVPYALEASGVATSPETDALALLMAAMVLVVWALITRLLHWDALADVADAYWGSHDQQRRLAIMSDPHVGAFGVAAVVLVALVEATALAVLIGQGAFIALVVAATLGRYAAVFGSWFGKPAKETGLGASVAGPPRVASAVVALVVLAVIAFLAWLGGSPAPGFVAGVALALVVPHVLASRFGGITGDVLGAGVMLTETAVLVLLALLW